MHFNFALPLKQPSINNNNDMIMILKIVTTATSTTTTTATYFNRMNVISGI